MIQIISPEERLAEAHGVHALIIGEFGIGKTSLLRTVDPSTATFIDIENGGLAVHDVPVPHITSIAQADICRASKSVQRSSSTP